jgi:hypothetical protein
MGMTKRQVIEAARDNLLKQGAWAWSTTREQCMYKDSEGRHCAIGGLPGFPQELNNKVTGVRDLFENNLCNFRDLFNLDEVSVDFLEDVQGVLHDRMAADAVTHEVLPFDAEGVKKAADELLVKWYHGE